MSTKPDGGRAFPGFDMNDLDNEKTPLTYPGMSLRDWFAGMAMQGMVAGSHGLEISHEQFASNSYALADAMLAERNK